LMKIALEKISKPRRAYIVTVSGKT
jgi:hypothetical protein